MAREKGHMHPSDHMNPKTPVPKELFAAKLRLLLILGASFEEWGFALFMQLAFLFGLTTISFKYTISLYFILLCVFTLLLPQDPILIVKYILCPLLGALVIFFI
ncbi:hypothetical protein Droror1_Dr00019771 [Drosera rotundifolia]